jgi:hypothetical protein
MDLWPPLSGFLDHTHTKAHGRVNRDYFLKISASDLRNGEVVFFCVDYLTSFSVAHTI